jgi:hypothetical protein
MLKRTRSLACNMKQAHELVTTGPPQYPSLRNGFNGYFALSLVIGLSCHHPRCDAEHRHQVDISVEMSGPHDFAVRGSMPFVAWRDRVHRIPHPTFVTIAKRPLCPGNLAERANGRLSQNRPLLELSP